MQVKTIEEVTSEVIQKLAAEGIEAVMVERPKGWDGAEVDDGDEAKTVSVLSIPAWEDKDGELSRKAFYEFIHSKLKDTPGKGFMAVSSASADCDLYLYNPKTVEDGCALDCWDLLVLSTDRTLSDFNWQEMVEGDDCAWCDGWDVTPALAYLPKRLANLHMLLNHEIVDIPALQPLSEQELIEMLMRQGEGSYLVCHNADHKDRWLLRLSSDKTLALHKQSTNVITPINQSHIDDKGRLVVDGEVLIHRLWL